LLRLAYHAGFVRSPLAARPILDAELYDSIARAIAAGDWLGAGSPGQPFYFNPLFPYLLGAIYHAFGPATWAVHLVQHGLGIGSVLLIALAARSVFGSGAALAAGLLAATYRPFLLREELMVSEPLVVFLGALGLVLTLRAGKSWPRALAAGLALGAGLLARPTLLPVAALVWLGFGRGFSRGRHDFLTSKKIHTGTTTGSELVVTLCAALGIALAVAPATLRNAVVAGKPLTLITAHGGETFYVGHRRGADGSNLQPDFVRSGPRTEHEDFRREASRRLGREVDLATSSAFWRRQAWAEIAADPGAWFKLFGKKAWLLLNDYEKGDNEDPATLRALIPTAALPLPGFGFILALAVLGALATRRGANPAESLLGLATLAYAAGCLIFFVTGRYRLPLAVPLLIVAGEGLRAGLAGLREPREPSRRIVPAAAAFAGALAICHWPLPAADRNDPALAAVNLGVLYEAQGDFPQATASYRRAIALSPELALAHFNLGVAERRQGHLAAADSAFRAALRLDPQSADALDQLGMTHEQGGDLESARLLYERALAIDPNHARTYRDLGRLHVLRGDPAAAIAAWEKALALAPGDSTTAARLAALRARPVQVAPPR
jgi:tetratricopeptide (TPR) repeat protein